MSDEKKKSILLKNFELLKDETDSDTHEKLASAIGKMYSIDVDVATDMWKYLLQKHKSLIQSEPDNATELIWSTYNNATETIGDTEIESIIINDSVLKQAIFSDDYGRWNCFGGGHIPMAGCDIIRSLIKNRKSNEVNQCLNLLYKNNHREASWYKVMDYILEYKIDNMNEETLNILLSWAEKAETESEKAKLTIKLMEYVE